MLEEYKRIKNQREIVEALVMERYKADKLRVGEVTAVEGAVRTIEHYHGETQDSRILSYIARNSPYVFLYRDAYTMRALRAGLRALQRKEGELERQCKEMNSQFTEDCRPLTTM